MIVLYNPNFERLPTDDHIVILVDSVSTQNWLYLTFSFITNLTHLLYFTIFNSFKKLFLRFLLLYWGKNLRLRLVNFLKTKPQLFCSLLRINLRYVIYKIKMANITHILVDLVSSRKIAVWARAVT